MTTANEIQRYAPSFGQPARQQVSQATAIEQSRAVAEVQAAVIVAQTNPRDIQRAVYEIRESCGRTAMAEQAFYAVPNRGSGESVHLLRELARAWGNIEHGSHELRRDDDEHISEVQAFAWDKQTNTRTSRTFITPHERMKGGGRQKLTDLGDIQNNNNNVAARAVRECISAVLPRWFVEEAAELCRQTLEHGEGEPLLDRIAKMVTWFGQLGVSVPQIEARLDKARGQWDAADVASMKIAGKSIQAGEATRDELFPAAPSSAASEIATAPTAPAAPSLADHPSTHITPAEPEKAKPARKSRAARNSERLAERDAIETEVVAAAVAADQAEGNAITTPAPAGPVITSVEGTTGEDLPGPDVAKGDRFYREPEPAAAPVLVDFPEQPGIDPEPVPAPKVEPADEPPVVAPDGPKIRGDQMGRLFSLRANAGRYPSDSIAGNAAWERFLSESAGRKIVHARGLTEDEATAVIDVLEAEQA